MNKVPNWLKPATLEQALEHGLSEEEFTKIQNLLDRSINLLELGICSALYSEHCSYKSSKVHLKTLPSEGKHVLQGPGENAGAIDIGDNQAVVFKIESHNHPSFIEPFQGAATGVGGILRDVFTMGARPLANLNALRFGKTELTKTSQLVKGAVSGIGSYGNCMGIPTIGGELFFHKAYDGNCLVNAFSLGLVEHDKIFKGNASGVGNGIFYVGSKTGRDGIHGATMASDVFDDNTEKKRPTVQVGDPFQEKLLLEACLEAMASGSVVGIQDMGAAGLTSSSYEMADRAGTGIVLHLDLVPQRETNMNPYEIMLSESQERMLVVVEKGKEQPLIDIFKHWELDVVKIGEVVEGRNVDLYWHGECVSSIPVEILTSSVPEYRWPEKAPLQEKNKFEIVSDSLEIPNNLSQVWHDFLASPNICSRQAVYDQYDSTVRSNTVIHPGGDAAVIRIKPSSSYNLGARNSLINTKNDKQIEKGVAITLDCNSRYCDIDPRHGTALSVAEACRNVTSVGAKPIGISDCLNFGSPQKPEGMWQIAESIRGLGEAARAFEVPIISGNVSLYNETNNQAILPTPEIAMVGLINDASLCVTSHFKNEGDLILLIGQTDENEIGGSEYLAWRYGLEQGKLPILDYDLELKTADCIRELINQRLLNSCHDLSSGGLAVALAEACFSRYNSIGASLEVKGQIKRPDLFIFSESGARYLVSIKKSDQEKVLKIIGKADLVISAQGNVGGKTITINGIASLDLSASYSSWQKGLEFLF
jgi:phosphoribosylformylglycinamidine synthase II